MSIFKLWSETNSEVEDKNKMWRYFKNKGWFKKSDKIFLTIELLNEKYKQQSFGRVLLDHGGPHDKHIHGTWFLEDCCLQASFDDFKEDFNDIFGQFGINVVLSRNGFIPRQDKKITREIYQPVLDFLVSPKWEEANRDLRDAFFKYREGTPQGYSNCITNAVSGLQAFLQILVCGETGKGKISTLIPKAQDEKLIPDDSFSKKIFRDIQSVLMQERQTKGDPHPKEEYGTEKHARLVLNLVMIFLQHCIQE